MAQKIIVDTTPGFMMPTIYYSQGDVGRTFSIDLMSRFGESLPASPTITVQATKPSGLGFSVAATSISGSVATFTVTDTMSNESGRFPAEIKVVKNNVTLYTANFHIECEASAHPEGTTDGDLDSISPRFMSVTVTTLTPGSSATYTYDSATNTATFGIPKGEPGDDGTLSSNVLAATYSSSSTYAVGDFCFYNGSLYRCTTAITTAEAWTAGHWSVVKVTDEISDLKADITNYATDKAVQYVKKPSFTATYRDYFIYKQTGTGTIQKSPQNGCTAYVIPATADIVIDVSVMTNSYTQFVHFTKGDVGSEAVSWFSFNNTKSGRYNPFRYVSESLNVLLVSASTFIFKNMIPMIGTVLKALPGAIIAFIKQGFPIVLNGISQLVSNLTNAIGTLADGLTGKKIQAWVTTALPKILSAAGSMIGHFAKGLISNLPKILQSLAKIGGAIVTGLGSALWGKVTAAAIGIRDRFMKPINEMRDKVQAVIDKIKGFFPISIGKILSNVKLPHFSISGEFSIAKRTVPKLSIDWYEKGGIIDKATVFGDIGMGESGSEAILPLTPFWDRMDKMAKAMQPGEITINVYATPSMDVKQLATEVEKRLVETQNRRRLAWQ